MQQINFYRATSAGAGLELNAQTMAWGALLAMMCLALLSLIEIRSVTQLRVQAEAARSQAQVQESQAQQMQAQIPEPKPDPALLSQAERKQRAVDDLKRLLAAVKGDEVVQRGGFSSYFEGLARQGRADVWLREIRLRDGGKSIELAGSALKTDAIPQVVQDLGLEGAFKARTFGDLVLQRPEQRQNQVDFILRTEIPEGEKRGQR
jgi:hypothetical protein